MSLRRSSDGTVMGAVDNLVDGLLNFVEELFAAKKVSLDEFASKSSSEIDKIILKKVGEGHEFIAGRFKLNYLNEENFNFSFEIYMKSPQEYTKINGVSKLIPVRRLTPDALQELQQKKCVTYEVEEPEAGTYSQVQVEDSHSPKEINENARSVSLSEHVNR